MRKFLNFLALASTVLAMESIVLTQAKVEAIPRPQEMLIAQRQRPIEMIPSFDGNAYVMGHGGTFIGIVSSDTKANNSICNRYGAFGSDDGLLSIRNRYGNMGSLFSDTSAYNSTAKYPPVIVFQGKRTAYLTKNSRLENALDPDLLLDALCPKEFRQPVTR